MYNTVVRVNIEISNFVTITNKTYLNKYITHIICYLKMLYEDSPTFIRTCHNNHARIRRLLHLLIFLFDAFAFI